MISDWEYELILRNNWTGFLGCQPNIRMYTIMIAWKMYGETIIDQVHPDSYIGDVISKHELDITNYKHNVWC